MILAANTDTIICASFPIECTALNMQLVEIQAYVAKCIATLRERGMRRTRALELVIEEMAAAGKPVTIQELAAKPALEQQCDQATVYRLVIKLLEQGIVRKLGLHERSAYFALLIPGEHHDYLVCTECGTIKSIDMSCPVKKLEKDIMKSSGFSKVYHELEFYGVCPKCA